MRFVEIQRSPMNMVTPLMETMSAVCESKVLDPAVANKAQSDHGPESSKISMTYSEAAFLNNIEQCIEEIIVYKRTRE